MLKDRDDWDKTGYDGVATRKRDRGRETEREERIQRICAWWGIGSGEVGNILNRVTPTQGDEEPNPGMLHHLECEKRGGRFNGYKILAQPGGN